MTEESNYKSLHMPGSVYERFEKAIERYKKKHRVTKVYPWQVFEFLILQDEEMTTSPVNEFQEKLYRTLQAVEDDRTHASEAQAAILSLLDEAIGKKELIRSIKLELIRTDIDGVFTDARNQLRHELLSAFGLDSKVADSQPLEKEKEQCQRKRLKTQTVF